MKNKLVLTHPLFSFSLVYSATLDDLEKEYLYDPQTGDLFHTTLFPI